MYMRLPVSDMFTLAPFNLLAHARRVKDLVGCYDHPLILMGELRVRPRVEFVSIVSPSESSHLEQLQQQLLATSNLHKA